MSKRAVHTTLFCWVRKKQGLETKEITFLLLVIIEGRRSGLAAPGRVKKEKKKKKETETLIFANSKGQQS